MKFLKIITISELKIFSIVGCFKKTNESIPPHQNKTIINKTYELKLKKGKFLIEKMTNVKKIYDFSLKIESISRKDVSDWTQKFITFHNQENNEYVEISQWMFFNKNSNVYNNLKRKNNHLL